MTSDHMTQTRSDEPLHQRVTSGEADLDEFRERLTAWLAERDEVDAAAGVEVTAVSRPESSGMSNISVLFDVTWTPAEAGAPADSSERRPARLVARMCPLDDAFPVFPVYDLQKQFDVMRAVGEATDEYLEAWGPLDIAFGGQQYCRWGPVIASVGATDPLPVSTY